ncbi:aminotransferase class IV [Kitasatospora sp. NPDC048545]|uniref:aminotransferase class IV n=1 Tax=Kitasatospora sp. NPDC048545 TaxID=3157208 RepID=UPI0033E77085
MPVLPGITRLLLRRLAARRGVEVRHEACRPQDPDSLEVWTVNALHGIRPVTAWQDRAMTPVAPDRAARRQAALLRAATPREQQDGSDQQGE